MERTHFKFLEDAKKPSWKVRVDQVRQRGRQTHSQKAKQRKRELGRERERENVRKYDII